MAKTNNKYTSINFNDLYDSKKISSSSSTKQQQQQHPNKSGYLSAASRSHGMLVLSRPSPNPKPQPLTNPTPLRPLPTPAPPLDTLNKNDSPVALTPKMDTTPTTPKTDKFVPPHLRPGFLPREETPPETRPGSAGAAFGSSPIRYGEDRRPKSGGGYYGRRGGFEFNRPTSGGGYPPYSN